MLSCTVMGVSDLQIPHMATTKAIDPNPPSQTKSIASIPRIIVSEPWPMDSVVQTGFAFLRMRKWCMLRLRIVSTLPMILTTVEYPACISPSPLSPSPISLTKTQLGIRHHPPLLPTLSNKPPSLRNGTKRHSRRQQMRHARKRLQWLWYPGVALLGAIKVDGGVANFCFGREGEMFILNENRPWKAQLSKEVRGLCWRFKGRINGPQGALNFYREL